MKIKLPKKICILDLETAKTKFKTPEKSKLGFVGIKVYTLHNKRYYPCKHKYYLPKQIAELEKFLKKFPGIIIGHNILQFDYRVLRPLISLKGVIKKTIDTIAFLYKKNKRDYLGLSLDNLSKENIGKGKTLSGKSIPDLWRKGKHKKVIEYNENDCVLTYKLWWHLVSKRFLYLNYYNRYEQDYIFKIIKVTDNNLLYLVGKRPKYSFHTWEKKINKHGYILKKKDRDFYFADREVGYVPRAETMYHWFYCSRCKRTFLFESGILRGDADLEIVKCPKCGKQFGGIRSDLGHSLIGDLRGNFGIGSYQGLIPEPFKELVLEHIKSTYPEWGQPLLEKLRLSEKKCNICKRGVEKPDVLYTNPADGSPICAECLTAGRWMLYLK